MSVVLDASVTLSWYFEDERTEATDAILEKVAEAGAHAPAIWPLEVANGLQVALRRKRIDVAFRSSALLRLEALQVTIDPETTTNAWTETVRLADLYGLTVYDAAYLELARRRRLPLASLDVALRQAASAAGIAVIGL